MRLSQVVRNLSSAAVLHIRSWMCFSVSKHEKTKPVECHRELTL
jgi:hypothetical protein